MSFEKRTSNSLRYENLPPNSIGVENRFTRKRRVWIFSLHEGLDKNEYIYTRHCHTRYEHRALLIARGDICDDNIKAHGEITWSGGARYNIEIRRFFQNDLTDCPRSMVVHNIMRYRVNILAAHKTSSKTKK